MRNPKNQSRGLPVREPEIDALSLEIENWYQLPAARRQEIMQEAPLWLKLRIRFLRALAASIIVLPFLGIVALGVTYKDLTKGRLECVEGYQPQGIVCVDGKAIPTNTYLRHKLSQDKPKTN